MSWLHQAPSSITSPDTTFVSGELTGHSPLSSVMGAILDTGRSGVLTLCLEGVGTGLFQIPFRGGVPVDATLTPADWEEGEEPAPGRISWGADTEGMSPESRRRVSLGAHRIATLTNLLWSCSGSWIIDFEEDPDPQDALFCIPAASWRNLLAPAIETPLTPTGPDQADGPPPEGPGAGTMMGDAEFSAPLCPKHTLPTMGCPQPSDTANQPLSAAGVRTPLSTVVAVSPGRKGEGLPSPGIWSALLCALVVIVLMEAGESLLPLRGEALADWTSPHLQHGDGLFSSLLHFAGGGFLLRRLVMAGAGLVGILLLSGWLPAAGTHQDVRPTLSPSLSLLMAAVFGLLMGAVFTSGLGIHPNILLIPLPVLLVMVFLHAIGDELFFRLFMGKLLSNSPRGRCRGLLTVLFSAGIYGMYGLFHLSPLWALDHQPLSHGYSGATIGAALIALTIGLPLAALYQAARSVKVTIVAQACMGLFVVFSAAGGGA